MKKFLAVILGVFTLMSCILAFASCEKPENKTTAAPPEQSDLAYVRDKGKLVIGITEYKPMDYKDENGKWTGFDVEYAEAVAEKLGVEVEFIVIEWENKVFELDGKKIDLVWNGMTITDELKKGMDITEPYAKNAQVVVMDAKKASEYKTPESLKPLKFAVEAGSAGKNVAQENGFDFTELTAQSDALLEVATGKADACIIDLAMANSMTGEGTSYDKLAACQSLQEEEFGIGCRKGSDMCEKINGITKELLSDGTLKTISEKYNIVLAD